MYPKANFWEISTMGWSLEAYRLDGSVKKNYENQFRMILVCTSSVDLITSHATFSDISASCAT